MRLRSLTLASTLVAFAAHAAPPLSRSFERPAPAPAPAAASTAGLAQPLPPPPPLGGTPGMATRSVTPDPVARSSSVNSSYKISAGDQIDIYVWGDDRLQRTLSVLPDGTFAFPLAGTIQAAGRTPNEIETQISGLLASQYKGVAPQVTVSIRQPSGMQVSIIGKVRTPSTIAPTRYVSVLDALALVGGPTDFADINNIVVLRRVDGKNTVIKTHLAKALKGRPSAEDLSDASNPLLMAGDTVVVP